MHLPSLLLLFHFVEAVMEARAMAWGVLAVIAGTLGAVLLWNIKASESCFCVFLWKCLFFFYATSLPFLCGVCCMFLLNWIIQTSLWFMLCPVSSPAVGDGGTLKETSSALKIEASQCFGRRLQIAFLHKSSLLWWKYNICHSPE